MYHVNFLISIFFDIIPTFVRCQSVSRKSENTLYSIHPRSKAKIMSSRIDLKFPSLHVSVLVLYHG